MLIERHMRGFFIHVIKENGGGEYVESKNQFSLSRQPFAGGHIFYDNPMNGFIRLTSDVDIKEVQQIWQNAINQAKESLEKDASVEK